MLLYVYTQVKNVKYTMVTSPQTKDFHSKSTFITPTKLAKIKKVKSLSYTSLFAIP